MGKPSRHILHHHLYQKEAENYRNYLLLLGYAKETCQSRYLYLKEFFSYLEDMGIYQLHHITAVEIGNFYEDVQNRKSEKTGKPLIKKTVYDIMRLVQSYLGYAVHLGKIKYNPASHLKFRYPNEEPERIIFTQQEIQDLYQATETKQEQAILHIAYGCGLRVQEISDLNKEDIRLSENLLIVQKGKNSKRRLVPINNKIKKELEIFLSTEKNKTTILFINTKQRRMQQWTFNSILKSIIKRTDFGKAFTKEELNSIGIHTLRHSIATHLLENGMQLEQVQQFLGHSHIESTEIYTHINQIQINSLYDDNT